MKKERFYVCIDLKSFYASVECVERTDKTICLAVSPAMKELGVSNRCRVFEIPEGIEYTKAVPRMQLYMDYSARIYRIYLKYISSEDVHVYSIDEVFMDVTDYQELLSGRREEGTTYSIYSFVRKLGQTAAGAGVPAVLGAIGYKGTQAVQSQQVLTKMFDAATIVPSVILLLIFILTTFCYKLGKSEIENLHKQLYGNKND